MSGGIETRSTDLRLSVLSARISHLCVSPAFPLSLRANQGRTSILWAFRRLGWWPREWWSSSDNNFRYFFSVASVPWVATAWARGSVPVATRINLKLRSIGFFWVVRALPLGDPGSRAGCVVLDSFVLCQKHKLWKQADQNSKSDFAVPF